MLVVTKIIYVSAVASYSLTPILNNKLTTNPRLAIAWTQTISDVYHTLSHTHTLAKHSLTDTHIVNKVKTCENLFTIIIYNRKVWLHEHLVLEGIQEFTSMKMQTTQMSYIVTQRVNN